MNAPFSLLVVDDSEPNRDALSRRLAQRGYTVTAASGGAEAIALVHAQAFDLVLLDVEMPEVSGLDVLRDLRLTRSRTDLPIIMVTARAEGADMVEAFRLGANDYVTKPVDFPVALARIGTHLSHKATVAALRESEERYALAVSGARDGLWDWNLATNTVHWSSRWKSMLGYEEPEVGADPDEWFARVHHDDVFGVKERLAAHLNNGGGHFESEHRLLHRNGTYRWVLCRGAAVWNTAGVASRVAGSFTDVTDAKVSDVLTGLPNRHIFLDVLDRALKRAHRRSEYRFALLVLGLDRFTVVNDSLGPVSADQLLVQVANRLQARLRPTDVITADDPTLTLARLAGDEFNVLVDDITDGTDAIRVAERLRSAFHAPFDVDGHQVFTSASIGIAISVTGYDRPEDVLRDASIALHRAQADGATGCEVFDPAMRDQAVEQMRIETDLRYAIDSRAIDVHYQPIVEIATGEVAGFEALVRWMDPGREPMGPAEFIPIAERAGMIDRLDRLTLTEACHRMAEWHRRFRAVTPMDISVNVSSRQFTDPGFVTSVETALEASGLRPAYLKLEITEGAFIGDLAAARMTLDRLKTLGIRCSLDDFGTGYSSLSYLHQLPVDALKVDRSFVCRMGPEGTGSEMVRTIVALAGIVGIDVVAEGVETVEQLEELRTLGCRFVQGFYFSKPVDAAGAERIIRAQPWRRAAARAS